MVKWDKETEDSMDFVSKVYGNGRYLQGVKDGKKKATIVIFIIEILIALLIYLVM